MHSFYRAIGFSKYTTKSEQDKLINLSISKPTSRQITHITADTELVQINHQFGHGMGISVIGEYDPEHVFHIDHAFPYCLGEFGTPESDIQIEKHADKDAYSGLSDDYNLGMTLIYSLQNVVDYVKSTWLNSFCRIPKEVYFGALSIEGRVLCGIQLDHIVNPYDKHPISNKERKELIERARAGDLDALENLTLDDMDTYSFVSKRIKDEDLFTVVETYFMPYGIDNEQYAILGIIQDITEITNDFSGEMVYNIIVTCNDMNLNVTINSLDLQGEPMIGRRFKGIVWLQGLVEFL